MPFNRRSLTIANDSALSGSSNQGQLRLISQLPTRPNVAITNTSSSTINWSAATGLVSALGKRVQLTATTLPSSLQGQSIFWMIPNTASSCFLAATLQDAIDGINISFNANSIVNGQIFDVDITADDTYESLVSYAVLSPLTVTFAASTFNSTLNLAQSQGNAAVFSNGTANSINATHALLQMNSGYYAIEPLAGAGTIPAGGSLSVTMFHQASSV